MMSPARARHRSCSLRADRRVSAVALGWSWARWSAVAAAATLIAALSSSVSRSCLTLHMLHLRHSDAFRSWIVACAPVTMHRVQAAKLPTGATWAKLHWLIPSSLHRLSRSHSLPASRLAPRPSSRLDSPGRSDARRRSATAARGYGIQRMVRCADPIWLSENSRGFFWILLAVFCRVRGCQKR